MSRMIIVSGICWAFLITTIYIWFKYKHSYWQRHNIPFIKPTPILGNLKDLLLLRKSFGDLFQDLYASRSLENATVAGIYIFHTPALIVRNPDLIQLVLIKNFNMFLNRYEAADAHHDAMGALSLPLAKYPIWRDSRRKMTEYFTSGRLKERIYPLMLQIAQQLESYIERQMDKTAENTAVIEVKKMCALFTIDLTASLSFGIEAYSLQQGESSMSKQCAELFKPSLRKVLHFFTVFFLPHLTSTIRAKVFTEKYSHFMRRQTNDIVKKREQDPGLGCGDLIDILLKFKREASPVAHDFVRHSDFLPSQAAIFLLAGFETSSSLIAFTLYELAKQPQIQTRLRSEIKTNFDMDDINQLSYKRLSRMSYLDMIVAEALRLYPAAAFINRECTPGLTDNGVSLKPFVDFVIPEGMPLYISILGLHRDSKYWENPELFDPERFSAEKVKLIHPMTYIPFGSGPHGCIGSRLGLLQVKVGLVHVLRNYIAETCERTVAHIKFDPKRFMLQAEGGIYLRFVKDNGY